MSDKLIDRQRNYLKRISDMYDRYIAKPPMEKTCGLLKSMLQELESQQKRFYEKHEEILDFISENSLVSSDVPYLSEGCLEQFDEIFLTFKGKVFDDLQGIPVAGSDMLASTFVGSHSRSETVEAKLPKISLPKFSGDYMDWVPFKDVYKSLVHDVLLLSKIQKFHYLKGTLSGEAANLIKAMAITESNYDSAWFMLEKRYNNKRLIVETLIKNIFSIPDSDGSVKSIKLILDTSEECLASLRNIEIDTSNWDPVLIHLIAQKLDIDTRKKWQSSLKSSTDVPKLAELFSFLENWFRTLESIHGCTPCHEKGKSPNLNSSKSKRLGFKANHASQQYCCAFCEKPHSLPKCFRFLALSYKDKADFLTSKHICFNCLVSGHHSRECKSTYKCNVCRKAHHTLLHTDNNAMYHSSGRVSSTNACAESPTSSFIAAANSAVLFPNVLLYTIRVLVKSTSTEIELRALLDQGSQATLISEHAAQLLKLTKHKMYCEITGVGNSHNICRSAVLIDLWSVKNKHIITCNALVLQRLSSYKPKPTSVLRNLRDLQIDTFADPAFDSDDKIDLILGADIFSQIVVPGEAFIQKNLFFQNTVFGWVIAGPTKSFDNTIAVNNINLENLLRSFWEQEELPQKRELSDEEKACEDYFVTTTQRSECGRYIVDLPFKSILNSGSVPIIKNNHFNALKRFKQLEELFRRRPLYCQQYKNFMQDYEDMHHMSKVGIYPTDIRFNSYFMPHHGVVRESSSTTKLRVVFDGSSKSKETTSLNEELFPGPILQNNLFQILSRWRMHRYAFTADIEKMFRQIEVNPSANQRKYQQILWRNNQSDEVAIFELNTVTYGTTPAPYLSIRVLRQLAEDHRHEYEHASAVLDADTYVDDVMSGSDTLVDAISLHKDLCALLNKGGFVLRKWISNSAELLNEVEPALRETSATFNLNRDSVVKALGIQWNTTLDSFLFTTLFESDIKPTKRSILADSARLFDPLGWLTPSTIVAKLLFQKLWLAGVDWDEEVPTDIKSVWFEYKTTLTALHDIKIPRWIGYSPGCKFDLHCFCDASQAAYAAVVYARISSEENTTLTSLLQAKSKVAPIKTVSIPRLELCAAALLVKLAANVINSFTQNSPSCIRSIIYWSDSTTVLSWIRQPPSHWSVYVANRVGEIQRYTNVTQWRYVPSADNPADCASRGLLPQELKSQEIWWLGPKFLFQSEDYWPKLPKTLQSDLEERKLKVANHIAGAQYANLFYKFSKLNKLLRVISWCFRFTENCKCGIELRRFGILTTREIRQTKLLLIKLTQQIDFPHSMSALRSQKEVKETPLCKLSPFIDEIGSLRAGGRLRNSTLPHDTKFPAILAKSNPLSSLIISDAHERTLHGGITLTMSYVSREIWILSGVRLAKTILSKCITCFRYAAKGAQQVMGDLPSARVNLTRPFKHSGVDYAGPIPIKNATLRRALVTKGYVCLFVCMATKAIHLEAVSDLTTSAFLAAFRRFVARRGACTDLYSDCGTNFVGASKELKVLLNRSQLSMPIDLRESLSSLGTEWHFNPPASPNFGGLWEAGVKSMKHHLKRVMHDRILSFEELTTLLSQIEGCLNSRPLCPLSSDPRDVSALTPGHLLIGEPTVCVQEETLLDTNINRICRWKAIEKIKQHFWKRWYNEYLNRLQARPKWLRRQADAKINDLVLIADERCSPGQWCLGRIQEVHPGKDGRVRVVSIYTKAKILKRPISKICFLPVDDPVDNSEFPPTRLSCEVMEPESEDAVSRSIAE